MSFSQYRYEYAYAGWSLIIIYSSPQTKGHQLFVYNDFAFIGGGSSENAVVELNITGFLTPEDPDVSRMTCFVGEGDDHYGSPSRVDYIEINGTRLDDGIRPDYNVWNSHSNAIGDADINGVGIDTFDMSAHLNPGDTAADVIVGSDYEIFNVVYIILSFSSDTTTGGAMTYLIR